MKPKYSFFKNFSYALCGGKEMFLERAFQIEFCFFMVLQIFLIFITIPIWAKLFLSASLFIPLLLESINTAIEKVVDLASPDYHILAKHAKDMASFAVFLSIVITLLLWLSTLIYFLYN